MSYNFPNNTAPYGTYQASIPTLPAQVGYQATPAPSTLPFNPMQSQASMGYQAAPSTSAFNPLQSQASMGYQAAPMPSAGGGQMQIAQQPGNSNRFVVYGSDTYFFRTTLGERLGGNFGKKTGPGNVAAWSYTLDKYPQVAAFVQQANAGQVPREAAAAPVAAQPSYRQPVAGVFSPPSPGARPVQTLDSQAVTLDIPNRYIGSDGRTYQIVVFTVAVPAVGDKVQVTIANNGGVLQGQVIDVHSVGGIPTSYNLQNLADSNNVARVELIGGRWRVKNLDADHTIDILTGSITRTGLELPVVATPTMASQAPPTFNPAPLPVQIPPPAQNPAVVGLAVPAGTEVGVAVPANTEVVLQTTPSANVVPALTTAATPASPVVFPALSTLPTLPTSPLPQVVPTTNLPPVVAPLSPSRIPTLPIYPVQ